ncbi:hypothetical protein [Streptomyces silaceus]|uniref:hypothetical protein n=1 Tax=Streptomyces silaceus TaxID=545123 RepID=UPI0006EB9F84|nr:hypothetical protein [Streptomyces silaceus]
MVEEIDDIDWAALEHAYGTADDVPELLRAAGSTDPRVREDAVEELFSSLCHQGSIYSATVAAVPFVARLALEGPGGRLPMLWLLHGTATGSGRAYRQARRAVAGALPALLGLAADDDPDVRRTLVWIVAACEEASLPLLPLLRARFETEEHPDVRADLVTALGLLDVSPGPRTARNEALLSAPEPTVRRAAATDLLRTTPLPFPSALVDSALDAHRAAPSDDDSHRPWPSAYIPFQERLLDDPDAALRAVARGLPLAWELTQTWRDRERDVLPWLAEAAADAEDLCRVARVGAAVAGSEDSGYAAGVPRLAGHLRSDDPALRVAATLVAVRLRLPDALDLVLQLMDDLPEEAASLQLVLLGTPGVAVTAAVETFGPAAEPVARRVAAGPLRTEWLDVLRHFPALAADRVDDLVRMLPASVGVLAALGPAAGPAAARALRARAEAGDLTAALALARVDGDAGPAMTAVRALPDAVARRTAAVRVARELGSPAADLMPLLEERLGAPARESRADAAAAIWRVTGRADDMAPVVADQLARRGDLHEPHLDALRTLKAMRLLPEAARPAVEHIASSPRRVMSGFPCDGTPHPDLTARALARALLGTQLSGPA